MKIELEIEDAILLILGSSFYLHTQPECQHLPDNPCSTCDLQASMMRASKLCHMIHDDARKMDQFYE